jgi:hypothetical protein
LLDETMHLVQKVGKPLNFIDHHKAIFRSDFLGKASWIMTECQKDRRVQEIIDTRVFQAVGDKKALAGLPRTKEEMGFLLQQSTEVHHAINVGGTACHVERIYYLTTLSSNIMPNDDGVATP